MNKGKWYELENTQDVISPSLLLYPSRIEQNIRTMISIAGGVKNLRPHIKTHKMGEIIKMQMSHGITKFKCATIAEAELLAQCEAPDILLAMQPVGANIQRFFNLIEKYPNSHLSTLVDDQNILKALTKLAATKNITISLWMDINNGMNRTGILPNANAIELYKSITSNKNSDAKGFHVYDGHLHQPNSIERRKSCNEAFAAVLKLKSDLEKEQISISKIVAGGSPSFPFHAERENVEVSPGTTLLWDAGYGDSYSDMDFIPAAVLFTRIISKPNEKLLCLDLGHKSIAPEMPFPRVKLLQMDDCQQIGQSEEHLVLESKNSTQYNLGDACYAIPVHICPTVAKYESVQIVTEKKITDNWKVAARNQKITI